MTSKERKLKEIIELVAVQARIEELQRTKSYCTSSTYYRNRLTQLEEKALKLQEVIEGKETEEVKFIFHVPESLFTGKTTRKEPEDFMQFFKREFLVVE